MRSSVIAPTIAVFILSAASLAPAATPGEAAWFLTDSATTGGLVVSIGGSAELGLALCPGAAYRVHALNADAAAVADIRKAALAKNLSGLVGADAWRSGPLPYVSNSVNLLIDATAAADAAEVQRVLVPNGTAYVLRDGQWAKTTKPRPADLDEWNHYLHGPDNNATSSDDEVGSPRHMQWLAGPPHARSHEHLASVSAVVSANGRLFSILDDAPTLSVALPAQWVLVARDAFNGVELWRLPVSPWERHLNGFRGGPAEIGRRLVAQGDRVYVTLGYGKPLQALDAASGRVVKTYDDSDTTREIILDKGVLYLDQGPTDVYTAAELAKRRGAAAPAASHRLRAIDAESGKVIWSLQDADTNDIRPTTMALAGGKMFFQNAVAIVALDAATGKALWRAPRASRGILSQSSATLVVYDGVVLSADPTAPAPPEDPDAVKPSPRNQVAENAGELVALSAEDGKSLWKARCYPNFMAPVDVIVADGVLWMGQLWSVVNPGVTNAREVKTGKIIRRREPDNPDHFVVSHHRCHRFRATNKFLVLSRAGIELLDTQSGAMEFNHWVRGTCQHGPVPANGLIYAPPHACACYFEAMIRGFAAFTPVRKLPANPAPNLEKGPAYDAVAAEKAPEGDSGAWPTYRGDPARSGSTSDRVGLALIPAWKTPIGGRLSAVTVSGGKAYVSSIDAHTVYALDATTGSVAWSYIAGGRVDSPPTIDGPRVLFGCADGYTYCLRASDGALAWRFRAAPADQRMMVRERLESVWPVHGSVLVRGRDAWFTAGRTSYLDGGLYLYRVNAATGVQVSLTHIDSRDPRTGGQPANAIEGFGMAGALNDVLSGDDEHVFMRHTVFSPEGAKLESRVPHLFSPVGFLDDSWFHRSYWLIGPKMEAGFRDWGAASNQVPFARMFCIGNDTAYGFGRSQADPKASHVGVEKDSKYRLFAASAQKKDYEAWAKAGGWKSAVQYQWQVSLPLLVRAMVLADKTLFVAGAPDLLKDQSPQATAALQGKAGASLWAISTADGSTLGKYDLHSPPVFDGMAVGAERIFVATLDGHVVCFSAGGAK
ncbi:MAG: PQQ-binding-like beta-propeller repeat protein [Planctomycetaceae bacterium]|nr:PQQ-binding-like beta-propeller repeat protein [Planctomycetaceae bacterium]